MNAYETRNNIYRRINNATVECSSKNTIAVYFFSAPVNSDHVPNTCSCTYRYRGQKCTHLRELPEYLAFEKMDVDAEADRKAELGATVGVAAEDAAFLFA